MQLAYHLTPIGTGKIIPGKVRYRFKRLLTILIQDIGLTLLRYYSMLI